MLFLRIYMYNIYIIITAMTTNRNSMIQALGISSKLVTLGQLFPLMLLVVICHGSATKWQKPGISSPPPPLLFLVQQCLPATQR